MCSIYTVWNRRRISTLALLLTSTTAPAGPRSRGESNCKSDDRIHLLTRSEGHEKFDAAIGLRKAYLATRQHRRADNLCRDRWQQELALRPFQDVDVYGPVSAGRDSVVAWQKGATAGRINALAVPLEPGTDLAQSLGLRQVNLSVGARTYIQQKVAVAAHDIDEQLNVMLERLRQFIHWIGGPVEIDVLVRMIAYLLDIQDEQIESLDDPSPTKWDAYFVFRTRSDESHVEANELLVRLWQAVIQLPTEQRDAFALSFEDEAGEDLFTMLRAAEIVNWDEIAQGMGRSVQEVVRLRARMPMNGASVAEELKASRENVYKWRFRAIRRLKTELQG